MEVLFVRHGRAGNPQVFARTGKPDDVRPLTEEGRRRIQKAGRGLIRLIPEVSMIASSPLLRALQTATCLGEVFGREPLALPQLRPGAEPTAIFRWLADVSGSVALVGHAPFLGRAISVALAGEGYSFVPLKRGAACLLRFSGAVRPGQAELQWLLTARQLGYIAEAS